jgi:hypothetical protein
MNDSEFDDLLRTTRGPNLLPSSFRQDVWQRIDNSAAVDSSSGIIRMEPIAARIARPWAAVAGIAAMVSMGLWLGALTAPGSQDAEIRYAASISPFAHAQNK